MNEKLKKVENTLVRVGATLSALGIPCAIVALGCFVNSYMEGTGLFDGFLCLALANAFGWGGNYLLSRAWDVLHVRLEMERTDDA